MVQKTMETAQAIAQQKQRQQMVQYEQPVQENIVGVQTQDDNMTGEGGETQLVQIDSSLSTDKQSKSGKRAAAKGEESDSDSSSDSESDEE